MAQREFTYETRKRLVDDYEKRLLGRFATGARYLAAAIAGYSYEGVNVDAIFTTELGKFRSGEVPMDFIGRTAFSEVYSACIPSSTDREKYALITGKSNQFQYSTGYFRRSVRSKDYSVSIRRDIELMHDYYLFGLYRTSLSGFLRNELGEEELDLKNHCSYYGTGAVANFDMMIAAELDWDLMNGGPGELHKTIEDMILGENNTSVITVPIIRGILKSDDFSLHELLGKLLLAARLQEGLRQAVCENMDSGTTAAFRTLFSVIKENNLIRFSSVKRAAATWIGIFNENAPERISQKTIALMDTCLSDPDSVRNFLKSDDAMELMTALWATGFYSAEDAASSVMTIFADGSRNQILVAAYYVGSLYDAKFYSEAVLSAVERFRDDVEVVAALLGVYLENSFSFELFWDKEDNPERCRHYGNQASATMPEIWFGGDERRARIHADILGSIYGRLGKSKKPTVFSGCAFPWNDVAISKELIARRLCVIAVTFPGIVPKKTSYEMMMAAGSLGQCAMRRLLDVRDDKDDRNFALHALCNKELVKTASSLLEKVTIPDDECVFLESLLRYKDSGIRNAVSELISCRKDDGFALSVRRLLRAKGEDERFAGLNFISRLKKGDSTLGHSAVDWKMFGDAVSEIKNPSDKELMLIRDLFGGDGIDDDAADFAPSLESLYDENDITRIGIPDVNEDTRLVEEIADCDKKQLLSILGEFDKLMVQHRDDEYKDHRGNDHLLGEKSSWQRFGGVACVSFDRKNLKRPIDMLPFGDLWMEFYETHIKSPVVLFQLFILQFLHVNRGSIIKKLLGIVGNDEDEVDVKVLEMEHLLFGKLCQVNPGEFEYFERSDRYCRSAFNDVAERLVETVCGGAFLNKVMRGYLYKLLSEAKSADFWYKCESRYEPSREEFTLGGIHAFSEVKQIARRHGRFCGDDECTDEEFSGWFRLSYALELHAGYDKRTDGPTRSSNVGHGSEVLNVIKPSDYFRAYKLSLINLNTVYYGIIRINTLENSLDDPRFFAAEDEELFGIYMRIHDTIIGNELRRGEENSSCSSCVPYMMASYGVENVLKFIQALGKTPFQRGICATRRGYSSDTSRQHNFSRLIAVSRPAKTDGAEGFLALKRKYKIPEQKFFDLAMYNTKWIPILSEALSIPSLESGCFYFIAHMKESWGDNRDKAGIAKFTPLSIEELGKGAFDIDWFTEVHGELGEDIFARLYLSAKYITDGIRHARARKFADAALGKVTEAALEAEIERARNKDLMMSYPLIPITEKGAAFGERILHRYEFIQKFKKESRRFGAQRRRSEGEAVEIALENLSRSAGYTDVNRLNLNMESALIGKVREFFGWTTCCPGKSAGYEIRISVSESGKPSIECRKEGAEKILKSAPAAVKKSESYERVNDVYKRLKLQHERTRAMFENFMAEQVFLSAGEAAALLENPVVSPIVSSLVFITRDGNTGLLSKSGDKIAIADFSGLVRNIPAGTDVRVAHAYDLYREKIWHEWQKFIFDNKIVQPFKQVLRELYLKLDEEMEKDRSLMFAGNQIQPKKAVAALRSRRWIADYESGLQKVFYKQNLIAEIYACADWFSPADIECPVLEYVSFSPRRYSADGKNSVSIKEIDCILYSEIMRDVDLAVSVAHAGSVDPETSHSTIEMRRAVCEFTLPLFKIGNVRLEKNFAFIAGSRAEYSVHLGTGLVRKTAGGTVNIVAVHSQQRGKLFLPFVDEDPKTAEVLSKILMLARDEAIKDPYILAQITREI